MAAVNDSRSRRGIARRGGNLPRTHPRSKARQEPTITPDSVPPLAEREARVAAAIESARAARPARGLPVPQPVAACGPVQTVLWDIRNRLTVVRSVAYTAAFALKAQRADIEPDVAITVRRCVGDEVDRQVQRLDQILGTPPALVPAP